MSASAFASAAQSAALMVKVGVAASVSKIALTLESAVGFPSSGAMSAAVSVSATVASWPSYAVVRERRPPSRESCRALSVRAPGAVRTTPATAPSPCSASNAWEMTAGVSAIVNNPLGWPFSKLTSVSRFASVWNAFRLTVIAVLSETTIVSRPGAVEARSANPDRMAESERSVDVSDTTIDTTRGSCTNASPAAITSAAGPVSAKVSGAPSALTVSLSTSASRAYCETLSVSGASSVTVTCPIVGMS